LQKRGFSQLESVQSALLHSRGFYQLDGVENALLQGRREGSASSIAGRKKRIKLVATAGFKPDCFS
jgi:hypothetical protein